MLAASLEVARETYGAWACRDATAVLAASIPMPSSGRPTACRGARYWGPDGMGRAFARPRSAIDSIVTAERVIDAGAHAAAAGRTPSRTRGGVAFDVATVYI